MIKNKKIYLGALSLTTLTLPVMSVVACGETNIGDVNIAYEQARRAVLERVEDISHTDSTIYPFEQDIFAFTSRTQAFATGLGLISPGGIRLSPWPLQTIDTFFILGTDASIPSVTVQANVSIGGTDSSSRFTASTVFTITNFSASLDLSTIKTFSPRAKDEIIVSNIPTPAQATNAQIIEALGFMIEEYLQLRIPNIGKDDDYTLSDFTNADGSAIVNSNLKDNAYSYKVKITATKDSEFLKNETVVTINLPKLNAFDVSTLPNTFDSLRENWSVKNPKKVTAKEVIDNLNKQIDAWINKIDARVSLNNLVTFYSKAEPLIMPQTFDFTKNQDPLALYITARPYDNLVMHNQTITISLPILLS